MLLFKMTYSQCPIEPAKTLIILEALWVSVLSAADPAAAVISSSCS